MYRCHCGKDFQSSRARAAHQAASHSDKPDRYSVSRKKDQRLYNCQQCNLEFGHKGSTTNKFCSSACSGLYQWEKVSVPKIEAGLGGNLKRYLKEKFGDKCSRCEQLPVWFGQELVLQLDHIDGDSDNNFPSNVRLLCPNCHTQTETFGNAGKGNRYKKITKRNSYLQEYKSREVA
jgi:hypothetical protein